MKRIQWPDATRLKKTAEWCLPWRAKRRIAELEETVQKLRAADGSAAQMREMVSDLNVRYLKTKAALAATGRWIRANHRP